MNNYFIYDHVCRMTDTLNEIRMNRCIMRKKKEFSEEDLEMLDFMMKVAVNCWAFITRLPDEVDNDLKASHHNNWTGLKEHLENQFKYTIEAIKNEKKTIKRHIEQKKNREHDEELRKKLEEMRRKRAVKANEEGSN